MKKIGKIIILTGIVLITFFIFYKNTSRIVLGTFLEVPENLMDSGCTFYWSQEDSVNKKYAFVSTFGSNKDLTPNALIVINNNPEKLNETNSGSNNLYKYSNSKFDVVIKITSSIPSGNEGSSEKGILTVEDKSGKSTSKEVTGYCGT